MKYKEICSLERRLLSSNRESFYKQGLGIRDLIKMYDDYNGFCLSDEMLFSDLAKQYIKQQMKSFHYGKDQSYKLKIKGASRFIISNIAKPDEVYEILNEALKEPCTLEQARDAIKLSYLYTKITPEIFKNTYEKIKTERGWF